MNNVANNPGSSSVTWRKFIDCVIAIIGFSAVLIRDFGESTGLIVSMMIIVELAYCVIVVRRNRLLLLVYTIFLYASYSIGYANYLNPIRSSIFTSNAETIYAIEGMYILLLFCSCLVLLLPMKIAPYGYGDSFSERAESNQIAVFAIVIVLALILVFGFVRPDSLGGKRGSPSTLYEYSTVLFIVGFYLAGNRKTLQLGLIVLLSLFVLQNLAFGGRVTALQLLLILFFYFVSKRISSRVFAVGAVGVLAFFLGYGGVRTGFWNTGLQGIAESLCNYANQGLAWDTAYSSWYTSISFVMYDELTSFDRHLYLLRQWLLSIVLGGSLVPDSSLSMLTQGLYRQYGGGILPVYVWFHFKSIGVMLTAVYVSLLAAAISRLKVLNVNQTILYQSLGLALIYIVITSPRWFLYSPSQITRGFLLCFVTCSFLLWLERSVKLKRRGRENLQI